MKKRRQTIQCRRHELVQILRVAAFSPPDGDYTIRVAGIQRSKPSAEITLLTFNHSLVEVAEACTYTVRRNHTGAQSTPLFITLISESLRYASYCTCLSAVTFPNFVWSSM